MKKAFCLLLFLCAFILKVFSQSFYIVEGTDYNTPWNVHRVTITDQGIKTHQIDLGASSDKIFSIAIQGNTLYYISNASELIKAEIAGNKLINHETILPFGVYSNALTIDKNGALYWVYDGLYKYDPVNQKVSNLGSMPYSPSGDLLFHKGELYMAAYQGIIKINIANPAQSSLYLPTPSNFNIFGLTSIAVSSSKNKVYALSINPQGDNTDIIELDMDNRVVIGSVGSIPYGVLDAASEVEDGTFTAIEVNKIKQFSDCNNQGKGLIKVITKPHSATYTYTLNGTLSNNTGIFTNLNPGAFNLKISSPYEDKTMLFNVDKFTSTKPITTVGKQNPSCDVAGQITLTLNGNGDIYKIKYGNDVSLANTKVLGNLPAGNYHFDILNELDCVVDSYDIPLTREKCTIKVDKVVTARECNVTDKGYIQVLTNTHTDQYTYTLNNTATNTTGIFNLLAPGMYSVKIKSAEDEKELAVTIPDYNLTKPVINYVTKNPVCELPGEVKFNITGGNSTIYKVKYNGNTIPSTQTVTGLAAGTHHFVITSNDDCLVDELDIILQQDKCTIKFDKLDLQQQCDAIKKGTITVITKPHADNYTYSLNNITNATGLFTNLLSGNYTIKIKSAEDEITMPVNVPDYGLTEPAVKYVVTNPFCAEKGSIKFNLTPGYQVKYNNNTFAYDHTFTNLEVGAYSFTILKPTGCLSDQVSVNLVYEPCLIEINTATVTQECNVLGKGVIQVTGKPIPEQYTYFLNNGNNNHTGVFNMLEPGNYIVKVTASGGNTPKEIPINVPDYNLTKPKFLVTAKKPLCDIPGSIRLRVTTDPGLYNIEYKSSIYPFDFTFVDLNPGSYDFKILKKDGCIAEVVNFKLERESCNPVTFPNTFTPNGDGVNDIFKPNEGSRATNYQLYIYNRYGSLLYISKDLYLGWDGRTQGNTMPVGTYYWMVNYIDETGKRVAQKGFITLMR